MEVIKHTEIKLSKSGRGFTMYTNATFPDGSKKRLIKRVKEDDFSNAKRKWTEMMQVGLHPLDDTDQKTHLKINGKISVSEALQDFYQKTGASASSIAAYKTKLNKLDKLIGHQSIDSITTHDLNQIILNSVKDGSYSQTTVKNAVKVYKAFFNYCVAAKFLKTSPVVGLGKNIKSDKDTDERLNPFTDEDFKTIVDKIKSLKNQSLYYYTCFIYHACLRPNEVRNLRVKDVNLRTNKITVRSSFAKNNKKQDVPIYPALRKIIDLMELVNADKNDFVFSHNCIKNKQPYNGARYIGESYVGRWFRSVLESMNLYTDTGYSIYCFKHTSCIHKLNSGAFTLSQLSQLCRHNDIQQTMEYLAKISRVSPIDDLKSMEF